MKNLRNMQLAAFVLYARAEHVGVCMTALYHVEGFDELVGIRFCLN